YFTKEAQDVLNGTWKSDSTWGGIKDGMAALEGYGAAVPADVKQLVLAKQADIVAGKLQPFAAPIKDNEGKVRLATGVLSDEALNKMNYYVEGVAGKLPTK
ncbi:MAG TPA: BMP family ABC transporter substrate-binding protein, partial [Burkholderiaceae bacterium]|nr:BMP family ABC transporter substrate-binding protein [Burkholderiaceae bacterium]